MLLAFDSGYWVLDGFCLCKLKYKRLLYCLCMEASSNNVSSDGSFSFRDELIDKNYQLAKAY